MSSPTLGRAPSPDPRPDGLRFDVPPERIPTAPPERRGIARDGVRLLVASSEDLVDATFRDLVQHVGPADLLVVNTSTTRAAALDALGPDGAAVLHLSTQLSTHHPERWVVEVRRPDGSGPVLHARPGWVLALADEASATLEEAVSSGPSGVGVRLWRARIEGRGGRGDSLRALMTRHGRPITYGTDAPRWPLEDYQTVFARHEGSAEMPSAARPFSLALVADLVSRGVGVAPLQLHSGVSSQEAGERPGPERFAVSPRTAALVNQTRAGGGRVIAVGTTVVRALETVADAGGRVVAGHGWTDLVVTPGQGVRAVDGLITGWHEAGASHIDLLRAVAGDDVVGRAYAHALDVGYEWHQFGDTALLTR